MNSVLVIAGTAEARLIIEQLLHRNIKVIATVTSKLGSDLLKGLEKLQVLEGNHTQERLIQLLKDLHPSCVIDVSHPFAIDVCRNAICVCKKSNIPYLRFEREKMIIEGEGIIRVKDYDEAVKELLQYQGNIFLTIGSGKIELFTKIPRYQDRLYVRVLPEKKVIEKCEGLGFNARNIIAMKGPFTEELNIQFLKYCNADVVVTKETGNMGGTMEKVNAAKKIDIPIIIIERIELCHDKKASNINEVNDFIQGLFPSIF